MFLDCDVSVDLRYIWSTLRSIDVRVYLVIAMKGREREREREGGGIPVSLLGDISAHSVIRQSRLHRVSPAVTRRGIQEGQILVGLRRAFSSHYAKMKPKFYLCLVKYRPMKVYGRENV